MTTLTQSNRAREAMTKMKLILAAMLMMIGLQAKAEKKVYTEFVESTGTVTYYYDDQMSSRSGIVEEYNLDNNRNRFASCGAKVTKAVVDKSMKDAPLTSVMLMFSSAESKNHLNALKSIEGLENINTANVKSFTSMFKGCKSLTSLDLGSFRTEKATDMSNMFEGCESLNTLNISSFNTANVKLMTCMFEGCSSLTSLDLSRFSTSNVTMMDDMFHGCSSLKSLDISSFNTASVTTMESMFSGCSSLTSLNLSSFNTANVSTMSSMFYQCSSLTSLNLSSFNTQKVTDMSLMFDYCASLKSLDISSFNTEKVTNMRSMFGGCSSLTSIDLSHFNTANVTSMDYMFRECSSLTSLDLSSFNTASVTDMEHMFDQCSSLASLDLSSFNTANVTSMICMFYECKSLTSLDLNNFNTEKVKNFNSMFERCSSLVILGIDNFALSGWKNASQMFRFCENLATIYCNSDWSESNIKDHQMFLNCHQLKGSKGTVCLLSDVLYEPNKKYARPDGGKDAPGYFSTRKLGKFVYSVFDEKTGTLTYYYDDKMYNDIQRPGIKEEYDHADPYTERFEDYKDKVLTVRIDPSMKEVELLTTINMFKDLYHAKSIEGLENLNTSKTFDMRYMFFGCRALQELDLSSLNTASVEDMSYMFYACERLSDLDLTSFNTSKVTDMSAMFIFCFSLKTVDLSSFDMSNVASVREMFSNCGYLKTIYCTQDWSAQTFSQKNDLFAECSGLAGGKGTVFDARYIENEYARPDGGTERPGYFTLPTEEAIIDGINYLLDNKAHTATVLPLPKDKYSDDIIIPEKVTYYGKKYSVVGIGDNAFKGCDGLTSITVEAKTPLPLGKDAFEGVPTDIALYVPDESKSLYEEAEGWKAFEDIHTSAHVINGICYELDPNTYYAKVVGLPNGKYKGDIVVPEEIAYEGVKYKVGSIGKFAFARCPELKSVSLPSTITEIAESAFLGNPALTAIYVSDDNKTYCDIEGVVFSYDKKKLLVYPSGLSGRYTVPEGTERIEKNAFKGAGLQWICLPESLREIGSFAFDQTYTLMLISKASTPPTAEEAAFYGLGLLSKVYVPEESMDTYRAADGWSAFSNIITAGIKRHVQVDDLYYDLYVWEKTAEVVGPVNSPSGVVEVPDTIEVQYDILDTFIQLGMFNQPGGTVEPDFHFAVKSIGDRAFYLKNLTGLVLPPTITTIGQYAFYGCQRLTDVTFDEGLKEIKRFAFAKCIKWAEVEFPQSLAIIGSDALAGCAFEDLVLPDGVTTIGNHAFEECRKLKFMEIGTGVRTIGNCAFMNDDQLLGVYMNSSIAPLLGENAFLRNDKLRAIYVPCNSMDDYQLLWHQYADLLKYEEFSYYYTITALPSEHGTVEVPTSTCNPYMTAMPDEGYQFVKWTDGNTDNPRFVETPKENLVFEAVFEPKNYRWLVESSNDEWGYVSSPKTLEWYPYNTEMIAIAVPKDGYKFIKWNDGYMNTPYNFNLTKDTYLRAIFIPENEEPEIPQFTMQVTAAKIKWWKKDEAFLYSLDIYMDEECTQLFASYLFDKNGYIVAVSLVPKAPSRNWKEEQETEFQYTITGLTADTKYYYRMKTTDEEGKLIYTDEGNFRTLNSAVYVVVQHIDAIGEVTYTSECGTNIELAREAYDALSDENKALVTNYATLVAAEKRYAELEAAAKAAALAEAKEQLSAVIADLTTLQLIAQEYGMSETAETLGNAITAATAVLNSDAVSAEEVLAATWTALMALEDAKDALLLAAQAQFKDALDALLLPDDSEACILIIENAKSAVDELCLDSEKGLAENVEDIMAAGEGIYQQAVADLEAQRKAEQEPTGLEQTGTNDEWQMKYFHATKVMENGVLYLLHEGRMYDVRGARVR